MREMIVVRHGESEGNVRQLAEGCGDSPLTARGRDQAARVVALVSGLGWTPERLVTSPVARCVETARILAGALDLPVTEDASFLEIEFGALTGLTYAEIVQRHPDVFSRPNWWWDAFSEFGGESMEDVLARVDDGLGRIAADESVLLVTHGALLKGVLARVAGLTSPYYLDLRNCTCARLMRQRAALVETMAITHFLHAEEWPG